MYFQDIYPLIFTDDNGVMWVKWSHDSEVTKFDTDDSGEDE